MKTVALISGGKDSCFNMMQCVAEGHQIIALANLKPEDKDELDSYMYQTVGHQAIELYAEAMDLPLYRHTIKGSAVSTDRVYVPLEADEVEDLYQLLAKIKTELEVEAVAVGAILSDYQRVRVENVCVRLGLTPLAYLWQREQAQLLQEMVDCGMEAIIIKVAAMGLDPDKHLGLSIRQILPHMLKMQKEYGLNVCGEGGEYETFTLDCPLFRKRIIVDEKETVIHSADAFAPVGYIHFKKLHLEDKGDVKSAEDRIKGLPLTTSQSLMDAFMMHTGADDTDCSTLADVQIPLVESVTDPVSHCCQSRGCYFNVGTLGAVSQGGVGNSTRQAMDTLKAAVEKLGATMSDLFSMSLYVKRMSDFAAVNAVYKTYFGVNPPVRVCVEACLPENFVFLMDCQGWKGSTDGGSGDRHTMHVQGLSHWAPANIGPYSQATVVDGRVYIAGQIPLVPGTMKLVSGNITVQSCLSLHHVASVLGAMCPGVSVTDALLTVCYVVHPHFIAPARQQWDALHTSQKMDISADRPSHWSLTEFVVVPSLPRGAAVEWQVYAPASIVNITEVKTSLVTSKFLVHCTSLTSEDHPTLFTSQTSVSFVDEHKDSFDCDAVVTACFQCYSEMLSKLRKAWSDVPLLRVFYPASLCSYQTLLTSLRNTLGAKSAVTATFSLIPVVQLADSMRCLSVCH